jgi:DNA-binding transcriptional LysR family regulator
MGVTLLTSNELANASNLASTIIMTAGVHPEFQLQTVSTDDLLAQPLLRKKVDLAVQEGKSRPLVLRAILFVRWCR